MESWDDDNFEPATVPTDAASNKWEGEDEDDEVKENWEDEDEEKKEEVKQETDAKKPKKKSLQEKIAEKEKQKKEEMEKRLKEKEEEEENEISPEERLRMQKESDLKIALETTFGNSKETIDDVSLPETKEEFEAFTENLTKKLTPLSKNPEYVSFIENLTRNLCAAMSSLDIKKIKNSLDNLYLEKQKIEKGEKTKKSKGKGKAKLKLEGENDLTQLSTYDYDDYDDFM